MSSVKSSVMTHVKNRINAVQGVENVKTIAYPSPSSNPSPSDMWSMESVLSRIVCDKLGHNSVVENLKKRIAMYEECIDAMGPPTWHRRKTVAVCQQVEMLRHQTYMHCASWFDILSNAGLEHCDEIKDKLANLEVLCTNIGYFVRDEVDCKEYASAYIRSPDDLMEDVDAMIPDDTVPYVLCESARFIADFAGSSQFASNMYQFEHGDLVRKLLMDEWSRSNIIKRLDEVIRKEQIGDLVESMNDNVNDVHVGVFDI
jgi:hypothetical protein